MKPSPETEIARDVNRRTFLGRGAAGIGIAALNYLLNPRLFAAAAQSRGAVNPLDFAPKAKRVIFLYQAGGPSHLEPFDFKPKLLDLTGNPMPPPLPKNQQSPLLPTHTSILL